MTDQKRNRKTRKEMIEFRKAQLEKLIAQEEGNYEDKNENNVLKAMEKRLVKVNRALKAATNTLQGVENAKGARTPSIEEKIAKTKARLESQQGTEARAIVMASKLPADVETLTAFIDAAKAGEDVEFPEGLTSLGDPQKRTDEEHEADFSAQQEIAPDDVATVKL
jgi:DNA repair ATPase RecN